MQKAVPVGCQADERPIKSPGPRDRAFGGFQACLWGALSLLHKIPHGDDSLDPSFWDTSLDDKGQKVNNAAPLNSSSKQICSPLF
jgi:hypothetical protein